MPTTLAVVKVGGSLYDLPDLGPRLRHWLAESFPGECVVLVPGGGSATDVIRTLDRWHGLGEEAAHWLALRALTLNAYFLASLLPSARVIGDIRDIGDEDEWAILDVHEFARVDDERDGRLPHTWAVTSDALAARIAIVFQARHLVLLKSTPIPQSVDWTEAGRQGWVDAMFAEVLRPAPADLQVRTVNLRTWDS